MEITGSFLSSSASASASGSISKLFGFIILLLILLSCSTFTCTGTAGSTVQPTKGNLNIRLRLVPGVALSRSSHDLMLKPWKYQNLSEYIIPRKAYNINAVKPTRNTALKWDTLRLRPIGNVTIKWDVISWTPDGYVADITIYNFQSHSIEAPGWTLGWRWATKEVIWSMMGAQATDQGNCSSTYSFNNNSIPLCCRKDPIVVDLSPATPQNQRIPNCCKGGLLSSWKEEEEGDHPAIAIANANANATSSFQVRVGEAGTSRKTVRVPRGFILKAPGTATPAPWYTCGSAKIVTPTQFLTPHHQWGITQALMTWRLTCMYSRFMERETMAPNYNPFSREQSCF